MVNFVIIGDYESTVVYKLFGWNVVYVNLKDKTDIINKFNEIKAKNLYNTIFVIEDVYSILLTEYPEIEKLLLNLIPLPGIKGSKNTAKQKYKKLAAIATGIKLE
ncbi:MAG: hypothetical protein NZ839_02350 [Endomicrobia bacterium]|nr:hypothetical protein [Endomicrobiia bacterium]MCX7716339.1 hypothetical protein [Endomicrobiia bacterium]